MKVYEIVNPSDAYTLEAETDLVAAISVLLLGDGAYGLRDEEGGGVAVPFCLFGNDPDRWFMEQHGKSLRELADEHSEAVRRCFGSVLIGTCKERAIFRAAMDRIDDPAKRASFAAEWHDKKRSSMNDIGRRAAALHKSWRQPKVKVTR